MIMIISNKEGDTSRTNSTGTGYLAHIHELVNNKMAQKVWYWLCIYCFLW
jgi:hypothetical protein